jgi:uncharacterized protein YbjQ (UPF0145 family)
MGFFKWLSGGTPEEREAKEALERRIKETRAAELKRQEMDLVLLQQRSIPSGAKARLVELGQRAGQENAIFTSNLAPDELALLRLHGFRPRGLVTGSAVWHVGQAYANQKDCEVLELTSAYDQATALAVNRLKQERDLIGAHGVVGVRLSMVRHEWSDKIVEVQVMGTAVEAPPALQGQPPWLCDLSGQEWWALHTSGWDAIDLVWGYCTWFLYTTAYDEQILQSWNNIELTHWSEGLSRARNLALTNMYQKAWDNRADGITGVTIDRKLSEVRLTGPYEDPAFEREHHNLAISIIGTSVRDRREPQSKRGRTVTVLSLRDGKIKPTVVSETDVTLYD